MQPQRVVDPVEEFYTSLENIKTFSIWKINRQIKPFEKDLSSEATIQIITERKVLSLGIKKGDINWTSVDIDGKMNNLIIFSREELDYLKNRLAQTLNIWLLARYAHILWIETKNNNYAEIAISNYLKIIESIDVNEAHEIYPIFSAIFKISRITKIKIDDAKLLGLCIINKLPPISATNIICSILENNIYTNKELNTIADQVMYNFEINCTNSYSDNKNSLETLLRLFDKIKRPNDKIYELLARNEDIILAGNSDDSNFVKLTSTGNKAQYLKQAKLFSEYEIALKEFNRLQKLVILSKTSISFDKELHTILNEYLKLKGNAILELSGERILAYFAVQDDLVVDAKECRENADKQYNGSLQKLFNMSVLDINNNFKQLTTEKDKFDYQILQNYCISHSIRFNALFIYVFNKAITRGKINYYTIIDFLENNTWYGTKSKRSIGTQEIDNSSTWISLLAPGIFSFFSHYEMCTLLQTNTLNNYILAIDSLTLKFEGALRDFIKLVGGTTTIQKKGEFKEQLLEDLLDNPTIKTYFDENDNELFKFIFTKKGKNTRNNVAHCFMEYSDYNLQLISNIFFCLLRLGKYTFESESTKSNNDVDE